MRILTVIPLQGELNRFLDGCAATGLQPEVDQIGKLPVLYLCDRALVVATGGLGKAQFAAQTQHLIDSGPGWDLVICAGAAGAFDDRLRVGDVVAGRETVEFDIRNRFGEPLLPRFASAARVLDCLQHIQLGDKTFALHVGPIASGDEDVVEITRRAEIRAQTGALVTAWEGAGAARACSFSGVPFVEIRGVSDHAGETAPQDFVSNLPVAMGNVAAVVIELVKVLSH